MDALIKRHEGLRAKLYDDKTGRPLKSGDKLEGKLTGGYGHNFTDNDLSPEIIDALYEADRRAAVGLASRLFSPVYTAIGEVRQAALTDMAFNLGGKLGEFRHMIAAVIAEDWDTASTEALDSTWAQQVGLRAETDAEMLRTGRWPADPIV